MNHLGTQAVAQPRRGAETVLAANKVIRNTYMLLSMTLLFAAVTAATSVALKLPHPGLIITLAGYFGLLFATTRLKNSAWGILSVFALLAILGLQAVTGLFANDDIAFQGPLAALVDAEFSQWLTRIHRLNFNLLLALVGLHIGAILFYTLVKKDSLITPMITGLKEVEEPQIQSTRGGGILPFLIALMLAAAAAGIAYVRHNRHDSKYLRQREREDHLRQREREDQRHRDRVEAANTSE